MYWEWQRIRVQCLECGVEVMLGSLLTHHQSNYGVLQLQGNQPPLPPPPTGEDQTYRVSFLKTLF